MEHAYEMYEITKFEVKRLKLQTEISSKTGIGQIEFT